MLFYSFKFTKTFVLKYKRFITIKHLCIDDKNYIGLQFMTDTVLEVLVKELRHCLYSETFRMYYIPNTKADLDNLFKLFKGVAWIDCRYFFEHTRSKQLDEQKDVSWVKKRKIKPTLKTCPAIYIDKLVLKKYANNTIKVYVCCFERFMNYFKADLDTLTVQDIRTYLHYLVDEGSSNSYINQAINSIKFYFEVVMGMPHAYYDVERPRKEKKLPVVLSKEEVQMMLSLTKNIKHKCIIGLLYSSGMRRSELLQLKLNAIDSSRMMIHIKDAKGNKDRYTLLSKTLLKDLRIYFKTYRPENYLFESPTRQPYSGSSVGIVVRKAGKRAKIAKRVTAHVLRHSFATHLLEAGTDIRYIQMLLGHNSTRTTEIYTHIARNNFENIKNPLDL